MSWLSCRLRPSGHAPPGDGGPGGGGGGGGGCQGPGCNNEDDCGSKLYWTCDKDNNGTSVCSSKSFEYTEIPGVNLDSCDFPDSFQQADTGGNLKTWYIDFSQCESNCGTLCTGWVCDGPPANLDFGVYSWPCVKVTVESYVLFACTNDVNICPLNDCAGSDGKTYYQDAQMCEASEPTCKGDGGGGTAPGYCWECPSTGNDAGPCTETCSEVWDVINGGWFCPANCYGDPNGEFNCNNNCFKTCYECPDPPPTNGECDEVTKNYNTDCTYEAGDEAACDLACGGTPCDYTCTRYFCNGCTWDDDNGTMGDCVDSEEVEDDECDENPDLTNDAECDGTTGDYTSNDPYYATEQEAFESDGCVTCSNAYTCVPGTQGNPSTCPPDCTRTFDTATKLCNDDSGQNCYDDPEECYQSPGCKCKDLTVCTGCMDPNCAWNCEPCVATTGEDGSCTYGGSLTCGGSCQDAADTGQGCVYKGISGATTCAVMCQDVTDYCWECPSGEDEGCCTKTCDGEVDILTEKITCPQTSSKTCHEKRMDCEVTCTKECWYCPLIQPSDCVSTDLNCSLLPNGNCEAYTGPGDYYNSKEDCEPCGEESNFNNNETAQQLVYGFDYVDSVYERNLSNRKYYMYNSPFTPVSRGNLPAALFKERVHASVYAVYHMNKDSNMLFSDFAYTNLNNTNLEKSLNTSIVTLINEVKLATGIPIREQFLGTIRNLLTSDRLSSINVDELIIYLTSIKNIQDNYPDTRGQTGIPGTHGSEATALKMAGDKAYSLSPSHYDGAVKERMRLWKTIATDLNKNIPITLSDGTVSQLYYSVSDTVVVGSGTLTMSPGDIQKITSSDGSIISMLVAGDQDRAQILKIEDLQKIMYLLGDEYSISMNVKTDEILRMDERYGISGSRKNSYMLTLELSTITDLPRTNSFVANTQANYTYQTKKKTKNNWVQDYPWPYMVFYVDSDDPIFNYITNDGTITVTTKDFTADLFENDPTLNIYPRRIPTTIVLIPTNLDNYVPNHVVSTQGDYGERNLKFIMNADPELSDNWEPPYLKQTYEYPDEASTPNEVVKPSSVSYSFDTDNMASLKKYTNDIEVLPRPIFGVKEILTTLKDFKENWILIDNTVNWPQVFEYVSRSKMKNLYNECSDWEKFRSKLGLGKVSTNDTVNKNYPKVRDVRSNDKKITDPDYDTYIKVVEKPLKDLQPPPGPLE